MRTVATNRSGTACAFANVCIRKSPPDGSFGFWFGLPLAEDVASKLLNQHSIVFGAQLLDNIVYIELFHQWRSCIAFEIAYHLGDPEQVEPDHSLGMGKSFQQSLDEQRVSRHGSDDAARKSTHLDKRLEQVLK